ncbi:MAG: alpha/beta fold hydrolase [Thermoleophilia bacterium]|nr:alpha/beta fold hydrolase [Thermoleophilia bacterium]
MSVLDAATTDVHVPDLSRAVQPVSSGIVDVDGIEIAWDVFGEGDQTILFMPPWAIVHSRFWKAQIATMARSFRVVSYDGRGNGRSGRPASSAEYVDAVKVGDALAVLDATRTAGCLLVAHCGSAGTALRLAAGHPDRVLAMVSIAPSLPLSPPIPERVGFPLRDPSGTYENWGKANVHYWALDGGYDEYLRFFFGHCFPEPHSTKQIDDCVNWGHEIGPETLATLMDAPGTTREEALDLLGRLTCPVLFVQGMEDEITPPDRGAAMHELLPGSELAVFEGCGHGLNAREPVRFNLMLREYAERTFGTHAPFGFRRALTRSPRALLVSSPIGLGHAWRDVAIAQELRRLQPGLEIEWLAQDPVTRVLAECGEKIHPASSLLAGESAHITAASSGHELPVFQAWREMDEILVANFMLFHDVAREGRYDLWIGDEAWEVDYFLHENPELKTARYCFLTDFVGWLPMPEGGAREAELTADYNAEMIRQIERFPGVRDLALFVGDADDIVPERFGPGLPEIRSWTEEHFEFSGYVLPNHQADLPPREKLRAEFGWAPEETVVVVAVGGSGVGSNLLARAIEAHLLLSSRVERLRTILIAGPRIDPSSFEVPDGVELLSYVHAAGRLLAASDAALVQGGLTTTMELVAAGRPFVSVPLRRHFEQNGHVAHRLRRYGHERQIEAGASPTELADALAAALQTPASYLAVATDGARRAAEAIAALLPPP